MSQITVRHVGDVAVLDLKGSFPVERDSGILATVQGLLDAGERKILLNMAGVTCMDDSPGGEVMGAIAKAIRLGGQVRMCASRLTFPPFEVLLAPFHAYYQTENEALASFNKE